MSTRSKGRPKHRWEDDVKSDIANMRITNWKDCIRNRPKWKEFVEKTKNFSEVVAPQEEEDSFRNMLHSFIFKQRIISK
jgi:hypothetical protein